MKAWIVFKQDSAKKPHQMVGSVYAADPEMALLQARSVFARRPKAISMWVVPASQTLSWTQEEVARLIDDPLDADLENAELVSWQVFRKVGQRRAMTFVEHVGPIEARSAVDALQRGITTYRDRKETWVWMVVPDPALVRSAEADVESWFGPALTKTYKQQSAYGMVSTTRQTRSRSGTKTN